MGPTPRLDEQSQAAAHGAPSVRRYFHGSDHEFAVGDLVLPQSVTGVPSWLEKIGDEELTEHYTGEHVYHAADPDACTLHGRLVYEVVPLTPVKRDPEDDDSVYPLGWTRNRGPARVIRTVPRPT